MSRDHMKNYAKTVEMVAHLPFSSSLESIGIQSPLLLDVCASPSRSSILYVDDINLEDFG